MNAPTCVPMSPLMVVGPTLLNAPTAVNKPKVDVEPNRMVCARSVAWVVNSSADTAINVLRSLFFIENKRLT